MFRLNLNLNTTTFSKKNYSLNNLWYKNEISFKKQKFTIPQETSYVVMKSHKFKNTVLKYIYKFQKSYFEYEY